MSTEREKKLLADLMLDPDLEVSTETVEQLSAEQTVTYERQRFLNTNLKSALGEAAAKFEGKQTSETEFRDRLMDNLRLAESAEKKAAPESGFFFRLKAEKILNKLREEFFYSSGAYLRWTPALVILLVVIPAIPYLNNTEDANLRNPAMSDSVRSEKKADDDMNLAANLPTKPAPEMKPRPASPRSSAEPEKRPAPKMESLAMRRDVPAAPGEQDFKLEENKTQAAAGMTRERKMALKKSKSKTTADVAPSPALPSSPSSFDMQEQILKTQLKGAKTSAQKRTALKKLEDFYKKYNKATKLKNVRKQLKAFN